MSLAIFVWAFKALPSSVRRKVPKAQCLKITLKVPFYSKMASEASFHRLKKEIDFLKLGELGFNSNLIKNDWLQFCRSTWQNSIALCMFLRIFWSCQVLKNERSSLRSQCCKTRLYLDNFQPLCKVEKGSWRFHDRRRHFRKGVRPLRPLAIDDKWPLLFSYVVTFRAHHEDLSI